MITAAMLFFTACTPPNDAGIDVLPDDDLVSANYVDTFAVDMGTIVVDSVLTERLSRVLVGNYVDQELGKIYAESYLQFRLTGSNLTFGEDPAYLSLDSVVLRLDLTGFFGRYNDPIPLEVYQITQTFPQDTVLTSNLALQADENYDYGNGSALDFSQLPGFLDYVDIRLDDSLGNKLLFADTDSLLNNTVFTEFFKGLLIRSADVAQSFSREPGGIFSIDPTSSNTRLTVFYKDTATARTATFDVNLNSERYHRIYREDVSGRLLQQAIDESRDPQNQYAVVESGALVKTFFNAPGLKDLDPAAINKAEIILSVVPEFLGSTERFTPPSRLFAFIADSAGTAEYDPNSVISSGDYNPISNTYTIPLTNNLQTILAGRSPATGFILVPNDNGVSLNRAILGGPGHPTLAPKLRVTYTTLPGGG